MLKTEYNYNSNVFFLLCTSKFNLKKFKERPEIKHLKIIISLKSENELPEIFFWVFFFINPTNIRINSTIQLKKKHILGKKTFIKKFLNITKIYNKKATIWSLNNTIISNFFFKANTLNLTKIFPFKKQDRYRTIKILSINIFDTFFTLLNFAPSFWVPFNITFLFLPQFKNGLHFRFLLQNFKFPVL